MTTPKPIGGAIGEGCVATIPGLAVAAIGRGGGSYSGRVRGPDIEEQKVETVLAEIGGLKGTNGSVGGDRLRKRTAGREQPLAILPSGKAPAGG